MDCTEREIIESFDLLDKIPPIVGDESFYDHVMIRIDVDKRSKKPQTGNSIHHYPVAIFILLILLNIISIGFLIKVNSQERTSDEMMIKKLATEYFPSPFSMSLNYNNH